MKRKLIYLPNIVQNDDVSYSVIEMVNYLSINGKKCNVLYELMKEHNEVMVFNPIHSSEIKNVKVDKIVATIWTSVFKAKNFADEKIFH